MPLDAIPKSFGFEDQHSKGYFPHRFNRSDTQSYEGPLPEKEAYYPGSMKPTRRQSFELWYAEQIASGAVFKMSEEILYYCREDVDILRKGCLIFRELLLDVSNLDSLARCITLPQSAMTIFRQNYLKPDVIGVIPVHGYGGRDRQS